MKRKAIIVRKHIFETSGRFEKRVNNFLATISQKYDLVSIEYHNNAVLILFQEKLEPQVRQVIGFASN